MTVYLVRHTSVRNDAGLCYGQSEIALADSFAAEAEAVTVRLPAHFTACISSPMERCIKLAEYVCAARHLDVATDDALKELNFGNWELQPWEAIGKEAIDAWAADFVHAACPGGESFVDLQQRVLHFWEKLRVSHNGQTILLVTHAGVIRALLAHLRQIPLGQAFDIQVDTGSVLRIDGRETVFL